MGLLPGGEHLSWAPWGDKGEGTPRQLHPECLEDGDDMGDIPGLCPSHAWRRAPAPQTLHDTREVDKLRQLHHPRAL